MNICTYKTKIKQHIFSAHSDVRSETEEDSTTNELEENSTNELDEFSIEKNIIESPIKTLIAGETCELI